MGRERNHGCEAMGGVVALGLLDERGVQISRWVMDGGVLGGCVCLCGGGGGGVVIG